ncbi:ABC transporter ATP-binding protein [Neobacillus citreus]|uniref:ABC transporter ATP-binding protein n=1 Tax=Neobacillus citreus TaxID=2833578 RepID=A0A942YCA3_9BACI|nr:ABC transporter ATP-binding protein [Neobacillus citreus]MCH6266019.1 ABC transporter ATP-binding protein/permease [Neobacillus citreus]
MKALVYFIVQVRHFAGNSLYFNLLAMSLNGLIASFGILLLVPLINMTGIVNMGPNDNQLYNIFSFISELPPSIGFPVVLLLYLLFVIIQNINSRKVQIKNAQIQYGFLNHMKKGIYHSFLYAKWGFFTQKRKSDLINILTTEIARSSLGVLSFLQFLSSLIFSLFQIGLALFLSPVITIFVLLCGSILLVFNRKFLKRSFSLGKQSFELGKEYLAGITDQINGIKEIKSNTLEKSSMEWFSSISNEMVSQQVEYMKIKSTTQLHYKISSAIFMVIFLYISVNLFSAQAGQLMLIIVIFGRLWPTVSSIQASLEQIATMLPSLKAVLAIQEESRHAKEFKLDEERIEYTPIGFKESIQCDHIYFRYNNNVKYALKNINLSIPANQMTAIVGKSGAGKTTIIDLLMGLNKPAKGQIFLDGNPLTEDKLLSLRKAISYVPQDPFLFNGSIKENLLLVEPNASDKQIWGALEFSSAAGFVKALPLGLETIIGDRGVKLSGGERQRLVLARAILRNPSILILDEATSALDTENEGKIQEAIERLKGKVTIIVIAHRLSTIRNADQVVVLEDGEIIQKGEYVQLTMDTKGMFRNLIERQMEGIF